MRYLHSLYCFLVAYAFEPAQILLRCLLVSLTMFVPVWASAQTGQLQSVARQTFVVNSRTAVGGNNRVFQSVKIPKNCRRFFYSIQTRAGSEAVSSNSQSAFFTNLAGSPGFILSEVKSQIEKPFAETNVDFWICPTLADARSFAAEQAFNFYETKDNIFQAIEENACLSQAGELFFCFRNMHVSRGLVVEFEVAAEIWTEPAAGGPFVSFCAQKGQKWSVFLDCASGLKVAEIQPISQTCDCWYFKAKKIALDPGRAYKFVCIGAFGQRKEFDVILQNEDCQFFNL